MADIWQASVQRMSVLEEATSMGAAVTAGVGVGLYQDFSAINLYTRSAKAFEPNPANQGAYAVSRENFETCYRLLEPIFPKLK